MSPNTEKTVLEKEMLLLQKINNMLNSGQSQDKILNTITQGLTSVFNYHLSAIHILNEKGAKLVCKSYSVDSALLKKVEKLTGLKALNYEIPLFKGSVFSETLSTKKPMITKDITRLVKDHTDKRQLKALAGAIAKISGVKYGVGVPILARNKLTGIIGIGSKEEVTERDVKRLKNFGQQVGLVIEKSKLDRQLKEYSKELEKRVKERTKELKSFTDKTNTYLRKKTDQLLGAIGTSPFKEGEFDDASFIDMDPIGIVASSIEQVFENLERTNIDLAKSREQLKGYAGKLEEKVEGRTKELKKKTRDLEKAIGELTGSRASLLNMMEDMTETKEELEKAYEELKRSNELKDLFTDIMRHDLLNPIGIVKTYSELALDSGPDAGNLVELQAIKRNAEQAIKLIENATQLSKLESAEKLDFEKLDLNGVFKEVLEDLAPMLKEKNKEVEYKIEGKYHAKANPVIRNVFINFISNAIKYTPEGTKVVIGIEDENKDWKVSVKDYGEGISDENKEIIFERFIKGGKKGIKGTGLGLAIVKRITELHKGKVWVEDNPEGGSIFYVRIPKHRKGIEVKMTKKNHGRR